MAAQSSNQAQPVSESIIESHRDAFRRLTANLVRARSLAVAFRLGAQADSRERPKLDWDELMLALEAAIPDPEHVDDFADAVLADLRRCMAAPTA